MIPGSDSVQCNLSLKVSLSGNVINGGFNTIILLLFYVRKCDVINRGFSGYNARWCSHLLPQLVTKDVAKDAAVVTIFLGANDSNNFETNPRQHVPLEEFKERLTGMVQHLLVKLLKTLIMFISIFASLHILYIYMKLRRCLWTWLKFLMLFWIYMCVCVCVVQNNCTVVRLRKIAFCCVKVILRYLKNCSKYSNTIRIHIPHKLKRFFWRLNASFSVWYKNILKVFFCCCSALQKIAFFSFFLLHLTLKFKQVTQAEPQWCGIAKKLNIPHFV